MFHIFIFQSRKDKLKCELENVMVSLMWKSGEFLSTSVSFLTTEKTEKEHRDYRVLCFFCVTGELTFFGAKIS